VTVAAIVLAAGESSRMGEAKPLLPWGGQTLVEYQIAELDQRPIERVIVVLGHRAEEIRPAVERTGAEVVVNQHYHDGRASSLRAGTSVLGDDTETVLVIGVDQPRPRVIIQRLVDNHIKSLSKVTVPTYKGVRGHPAVLDGSLIPELLEANEQTKGLRAIIKRHEEDLVEVPFDNDVVLLDINDRADYEKVRSAYFEQVPR